MIEGPQGAGGLQELLPPLRGSPLAVDQLDRDRRARLEVGAAEEAPGLARGDLLLQQVAFGDPAQLAHGEDVSPSIPPLHAGHLVAVAPQVADAVLEITHGSADVVAVGACSGVRSGIRSWHSSRPRTRRLV